MPYFLAELSSIDLLIVLIAVAIMLIISWFFGREERDTNDFFLGGRKIPAWTACLSFVATEISALTIISYPAIGYDENWKVVQFLLGFSLSRIVVAFLFIPAFYKYNCTSIYEFLRHRFGPETQYTGSIFFFFHRLIASGVRLYATCLGVMVIMGWRLDITILLFTIVSIAFIAFGGIKAVVWAGAYQAIGFVIAGIALVIFLFNEIDMSVSEIIEVAGQAGRLDTFDFTFNLNDFNTFWASLAGGFCIGLVAFGTDQEMVQRLLTVKTRKASQKTIISTIVSVFPVYMLYLAIGTLLYVFYLQNSPVPQEAKKVMPFFVNNTILPTGIKGLVLAAIILASIDSPLSSLSSSFVSDIYRPLIRKKSTEKHYLLISRFGVIGFGIILGLIALCCESVENILWFAYKTVSITGGPMLGVFLLGLLTKRRCQWANVAAMLISTAVSTVLLVLIHKERIFLGWSWIVVIGTVITFTIGYISSFFTGKSD